MTFNFGIHPHGPIFKRIKILCSFLNIRVLDKIAQNDATVKFLIITSKSSSQKSIFLNHGRFTRKYGGTVKLGFQLLTSSDDLEVQILYRILDDHQVFRQIEGSVCQRDFYLIHSLFISCTLNIQPPSYHTDVIAI